MAPPNGDELLEGCAPKATGLEDEPKADWPKPPPEVGTAVEDPKAEVVAGLLEVPNEDEPNEGLAVLAAPKAAFAVAPNAEPGIDEDPNDEAGGVAPKAEVGVDAEPKAGVLGLAPNADAPKADPLDGDVAPEVATAPNAEFVGAVEDPKAELASFDVDPNAEVPKADPAAGFWPNEDDPNVLGEADDPKALAFGPVGMAPKLLAD